MPSLYDLSKAYQDIVSQELSIEEIAEALNAVGEMFEEKADNIAKLIQSMKSDSEVIKAEEQRLADRRKALENKCENLKTYLESQMVAIGKEKFKTSLFSFGIQNNPPSVKILDEEKLKDNGSYWIPQEPKLDKKLVLADLKEGKEVSGVELQQTRGLRIK